MVIDHKALLSKYISLYLTEGADVMDNCMLNDPKCSEEMREVIIELVFEFKGFAFEYEMSINNGEE